MKHKHKAISFLSLLLAAQLTCCGAAAPQTETSYFEEQGFTYWEGFTVKEDPNARQTVATQEFDHGYEFYVRDESKTPANAQDIRHREIVGGSVEIHICPYYPEEFGMKNIAPVVKKFFQAEQAERPDLTKEQWLQEHEHDTLYNCWALNKISVSAAAEAYYENSKEAKTPFGFVTPGLRILDPLSGEVFITDDSYENEVDTIHITRKSVERPIVVMYSTIGDFQKVDQCEFPDGYWVQNIYILIPEGYEDLTVIYSNYTDLCPEEEFLDDINDDSRGNEEGQSAWWESTYEEEFGVDYLKAYFIPLTD